MQIHHEMDKEYFHANIVFKSAGDHQDLYRVELKTAILEHSH